MPRKQAADVVASLAGVQQLPEHLHARHHALLRVAQADDLDLLADLHRAALDAARHNRAAARDREHVLDRHQERLVLGTLGQRNVGVDGVEQLQDRLVGQRTLLAVQRLDRRTADHRHVVAGELVLHQQLAHLHLDQVQQLGIVDRVALVQEHHDVGNADLAGQQDVLARLRHRSVHGRHHQDGAIHLRRTRDHVLDVVGMARAVDVGVVALGRRILHVARRNRQNLGRIAPALALGGLRNLVVGDRRRRPALVRRYPRQSRRQRRLAVINVTDRAYVAVRLRTIKLRFRHVGSPTSSLRTGPARAGPNTRLLSQAYFALTSSATLRGTSA